MEHNLQSDIAPSNCEVLRGRIALCRCEGGARNKAACCPSRRSHICEERDGLAGVTSLKGRCRFEDCVPLQLCAGTLGIDRRRPTTPPRAESPFAKKKIPDRDVGQDAACALARVPSKRCRPRPSFGRTRCRGKKARPVVTSPLGGRLPGGGSLRSELAIAAQSPTVFCENDQRLPTRT